MSTTPDPHVPDERDFIDSWACRHVEYDIPADERADVARAFLARVRADAWDVGQTAGWEEAQEKWQIDGAVGDMWKRADARNPYREQENNR